MDATLYVGNLARATTAQDVRRLFSQVGTVTSVQLLGETDNFESKSYAHVTMATAAAAQKAVGQFHNSELGGSRLAVSFVQPRKTVAGFQSRLGAFGPTDQGVKTNPSKTRPARGGHQSSLSAFGGGKSAPTPPRRRGGSQHR